MVESGASSPSYPSPNQPGQEAKFNREEGNGVQLGYQTTLCMVLSATHGALSKATWGWHPS